MATLVRSDVMNMTPAIISYDNPTATRSFLVDVSDEAGGTRKVAAAQYIIDNVVGYYDQHPQIEAALLGLVAISFASSPYKTENDSRVFSYCLLCPSITTKSRIWLENASGWLCED